MTHRKRLAPTLLQAWLLAGLLLAAQALGLAHRVAHGGGAGTAPAVSAKAFADGHEAGSAECRLIDQLAQGDLLCGDAPALPLPLFVQAAPPLAAPASLPALPAGAYQARAPPRG